MKTFIQMISFTMKHNQFVFLFVFAVVSAKIYKKCELAQELKFKYEFDVKQIPVWVCIAKHESDFNTSAVNRGSGDHGLFQISDLYWCDTKRQGRACSAQCKFFEDDDISDDVDCVKTIFNEHEKISGNGFDAWVVYSIFCKDKNTTFLEECSFYVDSKSFVNTTNSSKLLTKMEKNKSYKLIAEEKAPGATRQLMSVDDKFKRTEDRRSSSRIFTSLGYYVLNTSTQKNFQNFQTSTEFSPISTFLSSKYTPFIFKHTPPSATVEYHPSDNNSRKHFSVSRTENSVELKSSGHIFREIPPLQDILGQYNIRKNTISSYRGSKTLQLSFPENRISNMRSQDEIVQEIKLGEKYSFGRTRRGGFQLRLI